MINDINGLIETQKEILKTLPKNNKKNVSKYLNYINDLKKEFIDKKNRVSLAIDNKKINIMLKLTEKINYDEMSNDIEALKSKMYIVNDYNTSYEKMGFDKLLYYMEYEGHTLDTINDCIKACLSKFEEVGVLLKLDDFKYTPVVYDYMSHYYKNEQVKEYFESIYWKYPNIVSHLQITFRNLYLKNKKYFDKYFINKSSELKLDLISTYQSYKRNYDNTFNNDIFNIYNMFINKSIIPIDYTDAKIEQLINNYCEDSSNYLELLDKLRNTLMEYNSYLSFKYIIEDMNKLFLEKDKYKNSVKLKLKEISKAESSLSKVTKKIFAYKKKNKDVSVLETEMSSIVDNIKILYDSLDCDKFNEILMTFTSSDGLNKFLELSYSYYIYYAKCLKNVNKEANLEDIELSMNNLQNLLLSPYNTLINNININDRNNLEKIIVERYNLSSIKINSSNVEDSNAIQSIIDDINRIMRANVIKNSEISLEDIEFICNINELNK